MAEALMTITSTCTCRSGNNNNICLIKFKNQFCLISAVCSNVRTLHAAEPHRTHINSLIVWFVCDRNVSDCWCLPFTPLDMRIRAGARIHENDSVHTSVKFSICNIVWIFHFPFRPVVYPGVHIFMGLSLGGGH